MNDLVHRAMCEAHTAIDRRHEKVTRVGLVAWCDEQMESAAGERHSVIGEMRRGLIATALIDADAADAQGTAEAKAVERERIAEAFLDAAISKLPKDGTVTASQLLAAAGAAAYQLTR
jgi:hypothetical protein